MDLFELQAVLRLNADQYTEGIDDAEKKGTGFLDGLANTWTKTKAKFQTAKSILSPVIDIVTQAVESYSTYEQAVGGVQKIFGTAADTISKNARKAFKTAGMSINEYMDMCIQSGATMLQSVGQDSAKAADMMDMAILDMSDNVNALGTDMALVQKAYQGFSRGNFLMLDNLAIGYKGTQKEMERLLADAEKLSGIHYDIGNYADIVKAIHVIQGSMNISGTTAKEGTTTIQGSRAYMEAAKENMLIVQADLTSTPEEKEEAAKAYADAIGQYLDNIIPIITGVLKSLLKAVIDILPKLMKEVPDFVAALVSVITAILKDHTLIGQLVQVFAYAIVTGIAGLVDVLLTALIRLFNGDFANGRSAFDKWGVYDWIDDVFGFKDENGNTVNVGNKRYTGGIGVGAENFVPEGMFTDADVKAEVIDLAKTETLEGATELLELAFGKGKAGVGQDKDKTMTKIVADGYFDQTFGATDDAIYYIYKLLEHEGYDIEELKAMRDARTQYHAEKVNVWERNGEQIELPPGMTEDMAKNFLTAVFYAAGDEMGDIEDASNDVIKALLDKYQEEILSAGIEQPGMLPTQGFQWGAKGDVELNSGQATINVHEAVLTGIKLVEAEADAEDGSHAKGLWSVPYDDYLANLHRGEMVLTASQAREFRNGSGNGGADIVAAINGMRNDLQNLQLVVGQKAFGTAVVDYSGRRMQGFIGQAEDRLISGYGWG